MRPNVLRSEVLKIYQGQAGTRKTSFLPTGEAKNEGAGDCGGRPLWAGSDKGKTELRLPLRQFFGFVKFCFCCLAGLWLPFVTGVVLCCVVSWFLHLLCFVAAVAAVVVCCVLL